jgi:nucleoside-diphosphate-sugar epimerase
LQLSAGDIMRAMLEPASVAITGAFGRIGRALAEHLAARGYQLMLVDRPGRCGDRTSALGAIVELDLAQPPPPELFAHSDVVVHLAGEARHDASWETLMPDNIQASYNVAAAAIQAGCRRLIAASSVHAVYASATRPVPADVPIAPANLYGVTKCFVEALAFWCAHSAPMSAAAVRIGAFQTLEATRAPGAAERMADTFIAVPDLLSLLELAITAEYRFAVLHAAAPGRDVLLETTATEELLGWRAQHPFPRRPNL